MPSLLATAAAGLVAIAPSTGYETETDGNEYAASEHGSVVRIYSETTRAETELTPQDDCHLSRVGGGVLAFLCREDESLRLYDPATASWRTVPSSPAIRAAFGGDGGLPSVYVGKRWIQIHSSSPCYHCDSWVARIDRETGEPGPKEPRSRRVYEDLDHPALWAPLCRPFRRQKNPDYDPYENSAFRYDDPWMFGRRALVFGRRKGIYIQRCGSRRRTLVDGVKFDRWSYLQTGGGYLTWLEQDDMEAMEERGRSYAVAHELATGRTRRWRIPGRNNPNTSVSHTRGRLYVDKRGPSGYATRRYSVMLRP